MEPTLIIFVGIAAFGLSFKYFIESCKKTEETVTILTHSNDYDNYNGNNGNNNDDEVPPKYEEIFNN